MKPIRFIPWAWLALFCGAAVSSCSSGDLSGLKESTLAKLDSVRRERKTLVEAKLTAMMERTRKAGNNPVLAGAFARFHAMAVPGRLLERAALPDDEALDKAYLEEYYYYYDILFINMEGLVFYTIRRESDLGKNLFTSDLSSTLLAQSLSSGKPAEFVDYHYYSPSKEPAAFFITPALIGGKQAGWIAFQFSASALKEIMSAETGLGKTAEVYLANENKVMLTQSRLLPGDTVLDLKVETEAVERASKSGAGSGIIRDYRGVRVFSSFEKFQFAGANWVIIAEVDEEEVLTRLFAENRNRYYDNIFKRLPAGTTSEPKPGLLYEDNVKVDINEYGSARQGEIISTAGVTTCTAVVVQYPGRFSYLGHAYPLDRVYYGPAERILVDAYYRMTGGVHGDKVADLLGKMMREITYFNIYPSETRKLTATIAAVHKNSFARIVDSLLADGFYLSQIRILSLPEARYADLAAETDAGSVYIHWVGPGKEERWTSSKDAPTLEALFKDEIGYGGPHE